MDGRIDSFNRYLVMYGIHDDRTGVKGIRGDAPESAISEFIDWYRDTHRYGSGRKYDASSKRIRDLILA